MNDEEIASEIIEARKAEVMLEITEKGEVKVKPKTCDIGIVLGGTIHDLLKKAPENPVVRAHVMNLIKQEVPKELVSYEAIREWIEFTI